MYRFTEDFWNDISIMLQQNGIEPIYFSTICALIAVYCYKEEFKNWDKTDSWRKGLATSTVLGATMLVFFSILHFFGLLY